MLSTLLLSSWSINLRIDGYLFFSLMHFFVSPPTFPCYRFVKLRKMICWYLNQLVNCKLFCMKSFFLSVHVNFWTIATKCVKIVDFYFRLLVLTLIKILLFCCCHHVLQVGINSDKSGWPWKTKHPCVENELKFQFKIFTRGNFLQRKLQNMTK